MRDRSNLRSLRQDGAVRTTNRENYKLETEAFNGFF
jgi:hypothetical protein